MGSYHVVRECNYCLFLSKHDIVAPKTTARMLGNVCFQSYEIVQFGILKEHLVQGKSRKGILSLILVPNDPWHPRLAHTELSGG